MEFFINLISLEKRFASSVRKRLKMRPKSKIQPKSFAWNKFLPATHERKRKFSSLFWVICEIFGMTMNFFDGRSFLSVLAAKGMSSAAPIEDNNPETPTPAPDV